MISGKTKLPERRGEWLANKHLDLHLNLYLPLVTLHKAVLLNPQRFTLF